MGKEKLKKQIKEIVLQIKTNSKDAHFADKLVDKLLSLKGQLDVEPTRIHIEEKDVIKEYDFGSTTYTKYKGGIIFHAKSGMDIVIRPDLHSLYEHINVMLEMKDNYEKLNEDMKKAYENIYTATSWILTSPIYATIDDNMFFGIATDILKHFNEYCKKQEQNLQEETPIENAEFQRVIEMFNKDTSTDA